MLPFSPFSLPGVKKEIVPDWKVHEMASPKVMNGTLAASDETFPPANVQAELHPAWNKDFQVDSVSSDVATSLENKVF